MFKFKEKSIGLEFNGIKINIQIVLSEKITNQNCYYRKKVMQF